jgi:hypothetical protein
LTAGSNLGQFHVGKRLPLFDVRRFCAATVSGVSISVPGFAFFSISSSSDGSLLMLLFFSVVVFVVDFVLIGVASVLRFLKIAL